MTMSSRLVAVAARLPPVINRRVEVVENMDVTMPDGEVLRTDRWAPAAAAVADGEGDDDPGDGPAPVVLIRTPYGRRALRPVGRVFAERGYQVVIQSCRGTFDSGGRWDPVRHERDDGLATLTWIADQPWFGGTVFTYGPSYLGVVQWAVAGEAPPYLRAMAPSISAASFRDAVIYPGETFALDNMLTWAYQTTHNHLPFLRQLAAGLMSRRRLQRGWDTRPLADADRVVLDRRVDFLQDYLAHDRPDDPWWDPIDFRPGRASAPPSTLLAGWYDLFLVEQIGDFEALQAAGRPARLTVGPWTHTRLGAYAAGLGDAFTWFACHAPGGADGVVGAGGGPVRLYVMGSKRWMSFPSWPPPATEQRWYLHGRGVLEESVPVASEPDRYRYDPADPTPAGGGNTLAGRAAGRKDQRVRERRGDVVVFTGRPLESDLTVIGRVGVELHVRSSLADTDFFVRLCRVSVRGVSTNVTDGIVRLRPGTAAAPDGTAHLVVDLAPTAMTWRAGERLRLQVSSGAHPMHAANLGTGDHLPSAVELRVADQLIFHEPAHPSVLRLPTISA